MSKRVNLKAVQFSSNGDTIDIADSDNLSFTDGAGTDKPFSISAWVYVGDITVDKGVIISRRNNAAAQPQKGEWIVEHDRGGLNVFLYADPTQNEVGNFITTNRIFFSDTGTKLTSGNWHFITVTYDGSQNTSGLKVYKDGVEITTGSITKTNYAGMPSFDIVTTIGGTDSPTTNTFEDYIADIVVFDKELSQTEITEAYNGGKVKDMSKATTYNNIISWWKMGDDLDQPGTLGIKDYKSSNNGTMVGDSVIVTVPALDTDRIGNDGVMIPSSWGRTRQPKNIAGDHQVYVHGGIAGNMPTADPSGAAAGYTTENQRFLHLYWKAASTTATVTVYGYSHASGLWSQVYDKSGNQVKLSTAGAAIDVYRVFEIDGTDKVYFKQSGTALAATDLFAAATSTF